MSPLPHNPSDPQPPTVGRGAPRPRVRHAERIAVSRSGGTEGSSIVRYTMAAAAAVALAVAVSGCGGKKDSDSSAKGADPAKIVVWQMGDGSPEQTKFLDSVTAEFHQKHPKTAVQVQYVPWPQATQK